jgi:hypothetical protein
MPCKECITFVVCKGQDLNDLLIKCENLKKYAKFNLTNFSNVIKILKPKGYRT